MSLRRVLQHIQRSLVQSAAAGAVTVHAEQALHDAWQASQTPEPVLEPELKIIDPHHHYWDKHPTRDFISRYMIEELSADVGDGHAVVKTVCEWHPSAGTDGTLAAPPCCWPGSCAAHSMSIAGVCGNLTAARVRRYAVDQRWVAAWGGPRGPQACRRDGAAPGCVFNTH